ncbi:polymorphic toxin-type HINT domain-containing protein [Streptomyces olivaceus]|uniref:polymorphic toxin-type HINT domain-containing protein n=1 Tax=Streptomyces olivaceus TaxID=47716 RepID=UPI001CCB9C11|nr:polymorphic toxin-type HINT domain-containing protein [Streptomyces olivaceus]MBZ6228815.1 sugar-binding protein [Streptomyces olivaceus]
MSIPRTVRSRGLRRPLAATLSTALLATLLQIAAVPAAVADTLPGPPKSETPIEGSHSVIVKPRTLPKGPRVPSEKPAADWPTQSEATVTVPTAEAASTRGALAAVKGQPVRIGLVDRKGRAKTAGAQPAPDAVKTTVFDREKAKSTGVRGLLFALAPQASTGEKPESGASKSSGTVPGDVSVSVSVDYSDFQGAFGGSYGSRMHLVQLPACAAATPGKAECRTQTPIASFNDTGDNTLTAGAVTLSASGPTILAATAAASSDKGDYKATKLASSATWSTQLNTGDFTWAYPMGAPDVPGGLGPDVKLTYSSASIDGRTGNTNNQGSWVGDGFDLSPGFIERRYKSCADDGEERADGNKPGDLCWDYDNAYLTFNGKGGELVPTGRNDEFKLKKDDGTRVARLKSTDRGNGDNDGEYWQLTSPNGTRYYFGYNRLPGWSDGKESTDSTWSVPVYGNNSNEPCHAGAFADSWCRQAWRWNLDYVVDPHGNAMGYHYGKETNYYGRNLTASDDTSYTRGGYLKRIDYGLKSSRMFADKPLAQVVFTNAERCLPQNGVTCAADTIDDQSFHWYDTPWDLNCKAGSDCDSGRLSPSFWSRKRLTGVTTQVLKSDGTYGKADTWKLAHRWGMADTDYQLELDSVQHIGETATPAITLPKVTFAYTQLANRLDKTGDGYAPFVKDRLSTVADESGGQIDVNYSAPVCDWKDLPTPESNTSRCFPQYLGGDSETDPTLQWFNKYVTASVTATDRTGGAPDQVTRYQYLGDAAWHFDDDDGLTEEKNKTWSQWRGYGQVRVQTGGQGGTDAMKTQKDFYFLRGMDGDRKDKAGGTKSVSLSLGTDEGDPITDHASAAGFQYKTATYDKANGKVLEKSVSRPWHHQTASKTRDWGTISADFTGVQNTYMWTSLDDGAGGKWRTTYTSYTHDTVAGRVIAENDARDTSTAADNRCTRTEYATNTDSNILDKVSRAETVAVSCADAPNRSEDVISDVRTAYDDQGYGSAPIEGDATAVATLKAHDGSKASYLETGTAYDGYGRGLTVTDLTADVSVEGDGTPVRKRRGDGRTTTTTYSPATGRPTQVKTTTPPADPSVPSSAQTTTTDLDPIRGLITKETDTNGNATQTEYDALGRTHKVWLADVRTSQVPTYEYSYLITDDAPVAIATKTLNNNGGQITSYALYDGFLRARQLQSPGPDGGTLLADTFYDERGLTAKVFAPYYTAAKPSTQLFKPDDALSVETQTRTSHDGLGRVVEVKQIAGNGDGGTVLNTTTTVYGGDRTTVVPPQGGIATTTLQDARGNTTALRQLHEPTADAAYDTTSYSYFPNGKLRKITDPAGTSWSYTYDQLGRQITATDPDKGTTTSGYDDRGQLVSIDDARTDVPELVSVYDGLGRKTELHEGTSTGTLRAKWVYDTVSGAKGQLAESTRYISSHAYTNKVTQYDRLYRPIRSAVVIPDSEGALAGTYQTGMSFKPSGLPAAVSYSAAGSLPGGVVTYGYEDQTLRQTEVSSNGMTSRASYSLTGKPQQYTMGLPNSAKQTQVTNTYEWGTQRLSNTRVDRQDQPGVDRNLTYGYDDNGNVRSMSDVSRTGTDNQCFTYDHLNRLTEAWTQHAATCQTAPTAGQIGGPAPYWESFTYDKSSNRETATRHDPAGDTAKDTRSTYTYPGPGRPQAHSLSSVSNTGPSGTTTDTYSYDAAGNTRIRPGQTLQWDAEGHLAKITEGDESTTYVYDADGNRLIGHTPTEDTLYLGHTEVSLAAGSSAPQATRYVDLGGGQMAVRDDDGTYSFTIGDHQGTSQLAVDADDLSVTQRRTLPFGELRGTAPTNWPGTKGYVGGTDDTESTGLTHLGAREYDPSTGRFLSVDPLFELTKPQTFNGYGYALQNPVTNSDPNGLGNADCMTGVVTGCTNGVPDHDSVYHPEREHTPPIWDQEGRTTHKDVNNDGKVSLLPGIDMPTDWGKREKFITLFYDRLDYLSSGYGWESYIENANVQLARLDIHQALLDACHETNCPGKRALFFSWASNLVVAALSEGASARTGGKGTGTRKTKPSGCNCFLAGTDVLMPDGSTKDIEDVQVGDKVRTTDPETGETRSRKVTRLIRVDSDKHFNDLSIATGDGIEHLTATHEHPFWSPSQNDWVTAGDLKPGMTLLTDRGTTVVVTANRAFTQHVQTYNLTIDELHTYYVLAGQTPVLVHNSNGLCGTAALDNGDWQHIVDRHRPGGVKVDDKAGIFTGKAKHVRGRIAETIDRGTPRANTPDPETGRPRAGQIYEWDFGVPVGRAGPANGGGELTGIRVVVNDGKVVTAFPF